MNIPVTQLRQRFSEFFTKARVQQLLLGVYVWLCFVKLPATSVRDSAPQSWEAVLAFATANRLQWGSDIVFTFGPLGFLTSDYYWGHLFPVIVAWAFGFALIVTAVFLPFWQRTARACRIPLLVALPLLTVPLCGDLGFDAIYLFGIMLLGVACLPTESPSDFRLIIAGLTFAMISAIKFSFSIYCGCAVLVIVASNAFAQRWRATAILLSTGTACLLAVWVSCGQRLSGLPAFIQGSLQLTAGYSSAMALSATRSDRAFGLLVLFCLVMLLLSCWLGSRDWKRNTDRAALVALGMFLAWKEGFVRADVHVVVLFVFAFFVGGLLPALLNISVDMKSPQPEATQRPHFDWLPRLALPLATAVLFLSLTPFATYRKSFARAVQNGFVPRFADTFAALATPTEYKRRLDEQLDTMRQRVHLPTIKSVVGGARIGVLNYHQPAAILNGLNYAPHPVFQSYSAFTPELQRLNTSFFQSDRAPEFILWQPGTMDRRVPTLDDGEVLLRILSGYHPVLQESAFVLWKRKSQADDAYAFRHERDLDTALDQWFPISDQPTWCQIKLHPSIVGVVENLLWSATAVRLEVRLADGDTRDFRLLPGNAQYGFLLNPLLLSNADVLRPAGTGVTPPRVVAARVKVRRAHMFGPSIRVALLSVTGLPRLESRPGDSEPLIANNEN